MTEGSLQQNGRGAGGAASDRPYSRLERSAYHEAGHAVAAYVLGRRTTDITIAAETESVGRCQYAELRDFDPELPRPYGGPQVESVAELQILSYLAGPIAESTLTGEKDWRKTGGNGDVPRAVDLAMYLTGDIKKAESYLKRLWLQTEELITNPENWAAIEALAAELVEHHQIDEERARMILAGEQGAYVAAWPAAAKKEQARH